MENKTKTKHSELYLDEDSEDDNQSIFDMSSVEAEIRQINKEVHEIDAKDIYEDDDDEEETSEGEEENHYDDVENDDDSDDDNDELKSQLIINLGTKI